MYCYLGDFQCEMCDYQEVEKNFWLVFFIYFEKLGIEYLEVVCVYYCMGDVEYELEEIYQVKKYFEFVLFIFEK